MRRLRFCLAIAAGTLLVGVYVVSVRLTGDGFTSLIVVLIPFAMLSYVAALVYLNSQAKPGGNGPSGAAKPSDLPPHCEPVREFATGMGLLFGIVIVLAVVFGIAIALSGGFAQ